MQTLTEAEIAEHMKRVPGWTREGGAIRRAYVMPDFAAAMRLANRVADHAEEANHHPDIEIRGRTVTFTLTTRDAGGLTERDFALAEGIDARGAKE